MAADMKQTTHDKNRTEIERHVETQCHTHKADARNASHESDRLANVSNCTTTHSQLTCNEGHSQGHALGVNNVCAKLMLEMQVMKAIGWQMLATAQHKHSQLT